MYQRRIVDDILDEVEGELSAIAIEGAKGVGKTLTATQRAKTVVKLDDPKQFHLYARNPTEIASLEKPVLVDEWQLVPQTWDIVRRAVDDNAPPSSFYLTGSASVPDDARIHSGAGRIVSLRMRPMSLFERGLCENPISLAHLLNGERDDIEGTSSVTFDDYVREIVSSGFPGIRGLSGRSRRMQLDGYIDRVVNRNLVGSEPRVRSAHTMRSWLTAYGCATATNASYEIIVNAATAGEPNKPARTTVNMYRNYLSQLYLLDPLPAWTPTFTPLQRLSKNPTHHLVDPALAVRLASLNEARLKRGEGEVVSGKGEDTFLGHLFESLAVQSVRTYAQACEAQTFFLRTHEGRHEIDIIVEGTDGTVVACEVKLSSFVEDNDVRHLLWLQNKLGTQVADCAVLYAGTHAYRRPDGVAVIPLSLLAP